ncbi:MAG: glycosyltransferase [Planctomycetota bacterium]
MRIARILTRLNIGGPARTALSLSARLAAQGHVTALFCGESAPREGDLGDEVPDGVELVRVEGLGRVVNPLRDVTALAALRAKLLAFRPDIVHTHAAKAGTLGRLAALSLNPRARLVHTYHGHVLSGYFSPWLSRTFTQIERWLARHTDRLVAVSPRIRDELVERFRVGASSQYRVIPGGVDRLSEAGLERVGARHALGLPEAGPLVGVIARLTRIKNHANLLRALACCGDVPPRLAVVGDGEERERIGELAHELGVAPLVQFLGWIDEPRRYIRAFDVVVLPSDAEGLPLVLVEAMAAGGAVLATAVGGVPDLVTHEVDGLLVPPRDPGALARALQRLIADRALRERLGRAALARATHYTMELHARRISEVYEELLGLPVGSARTAAC